MTFDIYEFTATEAGFDNYTFRGYLLPTGEVLCPEAQTNDTFYQSLDAVDAHGGATVQSYAKTGETVNFTEDKLREAIKGTASEFGNDAIPRSLLHWLEE